MVPCSWHAAIVVRLRDVVCDRGAVQYLVRCGAPQVRYTARCGV